MLSRVGSGKFLSDGTDTAIRRAAEWQAQDGSHVIPNRGCKLLPFTARRSPSKPISRLTMGLSQSDVARLRHAVLASLHDHWRFYLIEGIILMVLGAAAIIVPQVATLTVTIFIGWLFLISGLVGLYTTFRMRGVPGFWWSLFSAILAIVVGALLIIKPVSGAFSLTFVLIAFFVLEGVLSVMFALEHRRELPGAWGWMLASGIVDLALATIIFAGLPGTAAWAIGLLAGINLTFGGVAMVAMALQARRIEPSAVT